MLLIQSMYRSRVQLKIGLIKCTEASSEFQDTTLQETSIGTTEIQIKRYFYS